MNEKSESSEIKHETIEADIQKLAEEIRRIKITAEKNRLSETEIIKKSLSALTPITPPPPSQTPAQSSSSPLPYYVQSVSPEIQLEIEYLLDMAFHEGIIKALKKAQESKNPLILDAFHDALAGRLYPELKNRGIL